MEITEVTEIVDTLKAGLKVELANVDVVKAELEGKMASLDLIVSKTEALAKAAFDKGFDEGLTQAGAANGADKIFSNEEMEAELKPLKEEIKTLKAAVEETILEKAELTAKVDEIPALVAGAKTEVKSEILALYKEAQASETETETKFLALLDN